MSQHYFGDDMPFGYNCTASLKDLPTDGEVALSAIIVFGMFVSYMFQMVAIYRRKSSEGISALFLLLGNLNAFGQMENAFIYQFDVFACCPTVDAQVCQRLLLKLYQFMLQYSCLATIFILYLRYFPRHKPERAKEWKMSLVCYAVCWSVICCFSVTHAIIATQSGVQADELRNFADTIGYINVAFVLSQFVPQIYKTIKEKSAGAFSIPMLTIQTPGSFLVAFSLATGHNPELTTWLSNLVTGCLQLTLWVSAVYFYCKNRKKGKTLSDEQDKSLEEAPLIDDTTPLLTEKSAKLNA